MFIKTIKVKKPTVALVGIVAILLCIIVVIAMVIGKMGKPVVYTMKTETQRQNFLSTMGWKASEKYIECKVITIPDEFNDVYTRYNKLQKEQGFDLEKYKGKTIEIYTYVIYNYKDHEDKDCMMCSLMVCDGVLIGGDVCCTELDGFMQGLRNPELDSLEKSTKKKSTEKATNKSDKKAS